MSDRGIYNMQLQRAAYSLKRAIEKADSEGQRKEIQAALQIVERLQAESKAKATE